jgi:hypothetical protein
MEESFWKRLWTCRLTDYWWMNGGMKIGIGKPALRRSCTRRMRRDEQRNEVNWMMCGRLSSSVQTRQGMLRDLSPSATTLWVNAGRRSAIVYWSIFKKWSRHCATSRKVVGSIPVGVIGIFDRPNRSGPTMAPGSTKLKQKWEPRIPHGGKGGRCVGLTTLPLSCADSLEMLVAWTSWTADASRGTAFYLM